VASSNASAATPVAPAHISSLSLSLPSPQLQHRIFTSSGFPSTYTAPRHGDEEEKQQQQQTAHSRHSTPSHSPSSSSHSVTAATAGAHALPPISDADQPNDADEEQTATEGSGDDGAASASDENALAEQADQSATE